MKIEVGVAVGYAIASFRDAMGDSDNEDNDVFYRELFEKIERSLIEIAGEQ
jgi:hypothetical protein